jgi:CheY-like chemotaxis protein
MLQRVLPESVEIQTIPEAGLWRILVDPDGLQNAILNLALNARDAMEGRGKLVIEASNTRASHDYLDDRPDEEITPGRYVMISVTDNGQGMTPEVADRAFEPFFTTKHATDGSGLGLPSVLGFCQQSGGTCRVYSEIGAGTTIKLYFPAADGDETGHPAEDPVILNDPERVRILLAEDEDSVARVVVRELEMAGYRVKRVATGDAAWSELQRDPSYGLLISDLVMPGHLQGAELARRVEATWPDMSLLLISGYPQEAAVEGNGIRLQLEVGGRRRGTQPR